MTGDFSTNPAAVSPGDVSSAAVVRSVTALYLQRAAKCARTGYNIIEGKVNTLARTPHCFHISHHLTANVISPGTGASAMVPVTATSACASGELNMLMYGDWFSRRLRMDGSWKPPRISCGTAQQR
jgi:hypothetical protein